MTDTDVPDSVTYREIQEILRTFRDSSWRSISLDLHGMRITVGKDGPPAHDRRPGPDEGGFLPSTGPNRRSSDEAAELGGARAHGAVAYAAGRPIADDRHPGPDQGRFPPPTGHDRRSSTSEPTGGGVDTTGCVEVRSPAVGAFWIAPSPGQPPFVEIGQTVTRDEQLAIVEVMKLMNPVVAPVAGEVVAVNAANADLVEYEQVLFWIRPSDA